VFLTCAFNTYKMAVLPINKNPKK